MSASVQHHGSGRLHRGCLERTRLHQRGVGNPSRDQRRLGFRNRLGAPLRHGLFADDRHIHRHGFKAFTLAVDVMSIADPLVLQGDSLVVDVGGNGGPGGVVVLEVFVDVRVVAPGLELVNGGNTPTVRNVVVARATTPDPDTVTTAVWLPAKPRHDAHRLIVCEESVVPVTVHDPDAAVRALCCGSVELCHCAGFGNLAPHGAGSGIVITKAPTVWIPPIPSRCVEDIITDIIYQPLLKQIHVGDAAE